jgi:hypothetical protein
MGKMNRQDPIRKREPYYTGATRLVQTDEEKKHLRYILNGDMPAASAKQTLRQMDPNTAMASRDEFVRLIAALTKVYPEKMDAKGDKITMRKTLIAACQPDRIEWFLNNIRFRSRLSKCEHRWLISGTTRNEQIHAFLNKLYRGVIHVSRRIMDAALQTWLAAEMAVFLQAYEKQTTVRTPRSELRPLVVSAITLFTDRAWMHHVGSVPTTWVSQPRISKRKRRRGPSDAQEQLYKHIVGKLEPRSSKSVYQLSGQKRQIKT